MIPSCNSNKKNDADIRLLAVAPGEKFAHLEYRFLLLSEESVLMKPFVSQNGIKQRSSYLYLDKSENPLHISFG